MMKPKRIGTDNITFEKLLLVILIVLLVIDFIIGVFVMFGFIF
ncbi:hypothetical protein SAMN04488007_1797 [Maribacter aquivivus]|uniref:Uncharacterized protein n=2 Tax=Maribacter TaxID=252356 RepID=A0A1I6IIN2_9FLAO|nr:hypothetical protein SAMN04488010_1795 [Maribacter stanieri]SHJ88136.1 hypothetical protein SAMN04488007_1797 [Maribacter aquivivus]